MASRGVSCCSRTISANAKRNKRYISSKIRNRNDRDPNIRVGSRRLSYYLKSAEQIVADKSLSYHQETIAQRYAEWIGDDEIIQVGEKIRLDVPMGEWLCFSDCINNGGTSSLYLDFSPTEAGKQGQVIRYLHDPDSFKVIAPDFGSYLEMIRGGSYAFTEIFEEDWE